MAMILAIVLIVVALYIGDNLIFNKRLLKFEDRAYEFSDMYNILLKDVLHGDPLDDEVTEFTFQGAHYKATVNKGDLKDFYSQMKVAIQDVLEAYEQIGERYLSSMDEETEERISELYKTVSEIDHIVRYQCWMHNGI